MRGLNSMSFDCSPIRATCAMGSNIECQARNNQTKVGMDLPIDALWRRGDNETCTRAGLKVRGHGISAGASLSQASKQRYQLARSPIPMDASKLTTNSTRSTPFHFEQRTIIKQTKHALGAAFEHKNKHSTLFISNC